MSRVLITDGISKASLACVRSLGAKNISVTSGSDKWLNCTFFSKYVDSRLKYPSPEKSSDLFINTIYEHLQKKNYDVIMPIRDDTTIILSKFKEKFEKFVKLPVADFETIMLCRDKAETLKIAIEYNIPIPDTYFIDDLNVNNIENDFKYPILIRPRQSSGSRGISLIENPKVLGPEISRVYNNFGPVILQEYIPHDEHYSVCVLFNQFSELRASFVYKELRQYPISGGPATFSISVKRPDLLKYTTKLLKAINWQGVAHADFIIDKRNNKPKLLEINPRFWTSLNLAIFSGVDFPHLLYNMAIDGDIKPHNKYKCGVKMRVLPEDILCFLSTPQKHKKIKEFLDFNCHHDAVLSLDDPLPSIGMVMENMTSLFNHKRRRHVFDRGWKLKDHGD